MVNINECTMRRLNEAERIEKFDCGDEDLNDFALQEAHLYRKELLAVTYVIIGPDGEVLAFSVSRMTKYR